MTEEKEAKKKYYSYPVQFATEDEKNDFKNYMESRKIKGTPFYKTAKEMLELHKEHFKR